MPGDAKAAWLWRQLDEELERRRQSSLPAMEGEIEILKKDLQLLTTELIEHRAWSAQVRRVTPCAMLVLVEKMVGPVTHANVGYAVRSGAYQHRANTARTGPC